MAASDQIRKAVAAKLSRGKKLKKPPKIQLPDSVEREYIRELRKMVAFLQEVVQKNVTAKLERILKSSERDRPEGFRSDAWDDDLAGAFQDAEDEFYRRYTDEEIRRLARKYGIAVEEFNRKQLEKGLKRVVGIDVFASEPWLESQIRAFATKNVSLINSVPEKIFTELESGIFDRFSAGTRFESLAEYISQRFQVAESSAARIARDQVGKLNGQLTGLRQANLGVKEYVWETSKDERVRDSHAAKQGQTFKWNDPPADTGHPGEDINCFPEGTPVRFISGIAKSFARQYSGPIVKLNTEAGVIKVTPNHPILTRRGWVFSKDLQRGDELLDAGWMWGPSPGGEVNNGQATVDQVHDLLSLSIPVMRNVGVNIQFHGDGTDEEVHIVSTDSDLRDSLYFSSDEDLQKIGLTRSHLGQSLLSSDRPHEQLFIGSWLSSNGLMSFPDLSDSLGRSHARPLQLLRVRLTPEFYSRLKENPPDHRSRDFESIRDRILTHPRGIEFLNSESVEFLSIPGGASLYLPSVVLDVAHEKFSGRVFNFETYNGMYQVGQGIGSGNCRCWASPVFSSVVEGSAEFESGIGREEE